MNPSLKTNLQSVLSIVEGPRRGSEIIDVDLVQSVQVVECLSVEVFEFRSAHRSHHHPTPGTGYP